MFFKICKEVDASITQWTTDPEATGVMLLSITVPRGGEDGGMIPARTQSVLRRDTAIYFESVWIYLYEFSCAHTSREIDGNGASETSFGVKSPTTGQ